MGELTKVATTGQLELGAAICVEVEGKQIALFNVDGEFYAIDDTCSHSGGPLSDGMCEGTVVTCPWHGWQYDVTNGRHETTPLQHTTFDVRVEGNAIMVLLPDDGS